MTDLTSIASWKGGNQHKLNVKKGNEITKPLQHNSRIS